MIPDTIALELTAMAHGGAAFGRAADGRVVFVAGGLPGEYATARLKEIQARFAHGILVALPDPPAPDRAVDAPPCPHFGRWPDRGQRPDRHCGGCDWQHVRYAAQLRFKADVLADSLRRLGGIDDPPVRPALGMADPWRYRNRIRLRVGPGGTGFLGLDGATVVPVRTCPIAHPLVESLIEALEGDLPPGTEVTLRAGVRTGDRMIVIDAPDAAIEDMEEIEVEVDEASVILAREDGGSAVAAGRPYLVEEVAGHAFTIPPRAFFQVNTEMADVLVDRVRAAVPEGAMRVVDVFSGVGLFGVLLADRVGEVITIEEDAASVAAAVDNAAGLDNVTLIEADAAEGLDHVGPGADVVVLDPPRAGLAVEVVRLLVAQRPDTIVYVSCDPATLARDARQLVAGGWRLIESQPVDMFPQTYHVESVNVFRR